MLFWSQVPQHVLSFSNLQSMPTHAMWRRPVSHRRYPPKSMLSDVEEVIQFLVHTMEYHVFHHFTWNAGEWYGKVVIGHHFISALMYWSDIFQFSKSGKHPRINWDLKADILTSTSKPGLRILSGPGHFPCGKLFISLIRLSVFTSIGSALFVSSLTVSDICWASQNWSLKYFF